MVKGFCLPGSLPSALHLCSLWFLVFLGGCAVPQRSLNISLNETPLYPEKLWAVVNLPSIKVSRKLAESEGSALPGMVRFGNIVEVQRIVENPDDKTLWAYILWQSDPSVGNGQKERGNEQAQSSESIQGWAPYAFLHMSGNLEEARLTSYQMLAPENTITTQGVSGSRP